MNFPEAKDYMSTQPEKRFTEVEARPTVQILLPDARVLEGPRGSQLVDFLAGENLGQVPIVGAIVNGELRELTYPIEMDSKVQPVTMDSADGMRFYRRSLTFLLATACEELYPNASLEIDHSIASGGYYCEVTGRPPFTEAELRRLETRMRELVQADLPFAKSIVPIKDVIAYFEEKGNKDKVRLLANRKKPHLVIYQLGSFP